MPERNELVKSLQYPLDVRIPVRFNRLETVIDSTRNRNICANVHATSDYEVFWNGLDVQQRRFFMRQVGLQREVGRKINATRHVCEISPKDYRCFYCGRTLKWTFYGDASADICRDDIQYFTFPTLYMVKEGRLLLWTNAFSFSDPRTTREFFYFIADLPLGDGFQSSDCMPEPLRGIQQIQVDEELKFHADFENSNLSSVEWNNENKIAKIHLRSDSNTEGFAKWFYFRCEYQAKRQTNSIGVSSLFKPITVTFEIVNCRRAVINPRIAVFKFKPKTIYKNCNKYRSLWSYAALHAESFPTERDEMREGEKTYHTLRFTFEFSERNQRVLFASSIPFTFSEALQLTEQREKSIKLSSPLYQYMFDAETRDYSIFTHTLSYKKTIIGTSQLGLPIVEVEITSNTLTTKKKSIKKRPYIYIIARQRPSDVPASYFTEGILQFLVSEDSDAVQLRSLFVFKIVSMSNPDGVVMGQHRTLLSGVDMSLSWQNDSSDQAEIESIKQRLSQIKDRLFAFCEVSSHSSASKGTSIIASVANPNVTNLEWASAALFAKICGENSDKIDEDSSLVVSEDTQEMITARNYVKQIAPFSQTILVSVAETSFKRPKKSSLELKTARDDMIFDIYQKTSEIAPDIVFALPASIKEFEELGVSVIRSFLQYSASLNELQNSLINSNLDDLNEGEILKGVEAERAQNLTKEEEEVQEKKKRKMSNNNLMSVSQTKRDAVNETKRTQSNQDAVTKQKNQGEETVASKLASVLPQILESSIKIQTPATQKWSSLFNEADLQKLKQFRDNSGNIGSPHGTLGLDEDQDPEDDYRESNKRKRHGNNSGRDSRGSPHQDGKLGSSSIFQFTSSDENNNGNEEGRFTNWMRKRDDEEARYHKNSNSDGQDGNSSERDECRDGLSRKWRTINLNDGFGYLADRKNFLSSRKSATESQTPSMQDFIRLKNPFLPTHAELLEAYSIGSPKNIQNIKQKQEQVNNSPTTLTPIQRPTSAVSTFIYGTSMPENNNKVTRPTSAFGIKSSRFKQRFSTEIGEEQDTYPLANQNMQTTTETITDADANLYSSTCWPLSLSMKRCQTDEDQHSDEKQKLQNPFGTTELVREGGLQVEREKEFLDKRSTRPSRTGSRLSNLITGNSIYGGLFAMNDEKSNEQYKSSPSNRTSTTYLTRMSVRSIEAMKSPGNSSRVVVTYRPLSSTKRINQDTRTAMSLMLSTKHSIEFDEIIDTHLTSTDQPIPPQPAVRIIKSAVNRHYQRFIESQIKFQIQQCTTKPLTKTDSHNSVKLLLKQPSNVISSLRKNRSSHHLQSKRPNMATLQNLLPVFQPKISFAVKYQKTS